MLLCWAANFEQNWKYSSEFWVPSGKWRPPMKRIPPALTLLIDRVCFFLSQGRYPFKMTDPGVRPHTPSSFPIAPTACSCPRCSQMPCVKQDSNFSKLRFKLPLGWPAKVKIYCCNFIAPADKDKHSKTQLYLSWNWTYSQAHRI